jgi:hypothetical protein
MALNVAASQRVKSLELRAATSLAPRRQTSGQGDKHSAHSAKPEKGYRDHVARSGKGKARFGAPQAGLSRFSEGLWLVSFMHCDLGYFDYETCGLEPIANPFGAKVLPMSPE